MDTLLHTLPSFVTTIENDSTIALLIFDLRDFPLKSSSLLEVFFCDDKHVEALADTTLSPLSSWKGDDGNVDGWIASLFVFGAEKREGCLIVNFHLCACSYQRTW